MEPLEQRAAHLKTTGRWEEAAAVYQKITEQAEPSASLLSAYAEVMLKLKDHQAAAELAARSLGLDVNQPDAWVNRGLALRHSQGLDAAIECMRKALEIDPVHVRAHYQLGIKLQATSCFDEAMRSLDSAIAIQPDHAPARIARAVLLSDLRRFDEALAEIDQCICLRPDSAEAGFVKAEILLQLGDFEQGWLLHERRWSTHAPTIQVKTGGLPLWDGTPMPGKRLLVHPEIGLGDYIMFARFVPQLCAAGIQPVLQAPRALLSLLAESFPLAEVAALSERVPADAHCPLLSLPRALGVRADRIPDGVPYLKPPTSAISKWQALLRPERRLRVGIAWATHSNRSIDRTPAKRRSLPLQALAPLLAVDVDWHSLQKQILPEEAGLLAHFPQLTDHRADISDMADTAGLTALMDLVISVDTSVAHLAGALGRPLWVMLPYSSDYRWPRDADRTPWYPTAVQCRQVSIGDWNPVVLGLAGRLDALRQGRGSP